ncbi:MAG TPA: nuclear transport factor 2 family protein [Gaiellaceae bacterium]|nr:nuclear transport factor 2 family protein [Gaiellaceae bacterium]
MGFADTLLELEKQFWRAASDRDAYAERLSHDALHVLPGWGVASRAAVLEGVAGAEPWESFAIEEPQLLALGEDAAALVYTAQARRRSGQKYSAAVTSVYRRERGRWLLALHQQTSLGARAEAR